MLTRPKARQDMKMVGIDPLSDDYQTKVLTAAKEYGDEVVSVVEKDLEAVRSLCTKTKMEKEELFKQVPPWKLNMMVVRLNGGGLLLYAPVKIHKDAEQLLFSWLESLGKVKYVVVASSAHTLLLPDVIQAFPDAKVIGPKVAEEKLKYINVVEQFDYITTNKEGLMKLNEALMEEGVEVFNIEGDAITNAVVCLVQKEVLLECDLLYGHQDGNGLLDLDETKLKQWRPEDFTTRLFKFRLISKPNSPNGYLPNYRFWLMDPSSLGALAYDPPAKDGSNRKQMADSLRKVLGSQYNTAVGVHFKSMNRDEFKGSIDAAWNWLDGKSLK